MVGRVNGGRDNNTPAVFLLGPKKYPVYEYERRLDGVFFFVYDVNSRETIDLHFTVAQSIQALPTDERETARQDISLASERFDFLRRVFAGRWQRVTVHSRYTVTIYV